MKFPADHIWAVLVAFLATLGCYTAVALVGGDGQVLSQTVTALAGGIVGFATAKAIVKKPDENPPAK
jgi:outer membrane lipoprotein SlyB